MGVSLDTLSSCPIETILVSTYGFEIDSLYVISYHAYISCSHMGVSLDTECSCPIETDLVSTIDYKRDSLCISNYRAYIFCSHMGNFILIGAGQCKQVK